VTTRRNPFLWFRGTVEADDCTDRNVPLAQLERDLADPDTAPSLAFIASDAQAGSADADAFLERVVPVIQNSLTYADGGLIVITGDQPPPAAPAPDPAPTTTDGTPTAPDPAASVPTTPAAPPAQTTPTETTPTTTTTSPDPTTRTTTTTGPSAPPSDDAVAGDGSPAAPLARAAAGTATTPWPATYPNVGDAAAAGAGAPVGALLISPFTPAGRVDDTPASHFSLLRTIEQVFGVDPLGYAASDAVAPLPDSLFDAPQ
jgi:hypothetical protein